MEGGHHVFDVVVVFGIPINQEIQKSSRQFVSTELCYKVGPRLRELAPVARRELAGGIHATLGPTLQPISVHVETRAWRYFEKLITKR